MRGLRKLVALAAVDGALFLFSGFAPHGSRHSGTLSNVLWVDFLLGVLALLALTATATARSLLALRH